MEGIWTVIPTIFTNDNSIDIEAMKKLIDIQKFKVSGIVLNGTTSEVSTLSNDEKSHIYNNIAMEYKGIVPIMIGAGGNNTKEIEDTIDEIKYVSDYIMLTVPYYNKPSQEALIAHFTHIANKYPKCKFVLYNVPGRTAVNLEVDSLVEIVSKCSNIVAIKEASGNISQIKDTINRTNISVMCGDDGLFLPCMVLGCKGVISVVSNIVPQEMSDIYKLCITNDYNKALQKYNKIEHIIKTCFITSNPVPLKMILFRLKLTTSEYVRLPLVVTKNVKNVQDINDCVLQIVRDQQNSTLEQIKEEISSLI
jgi:4-hydroxy-tetrahydrodipicolinate synthase